MTKNEVSAANAQAIKDAIDNFVQASKDLGNILEQNNYELSCAAPTYLSDIDDFTYEVIQWSEDEKEAINESLVETQIAS